MALPIPAGTLLEEFGSALNSMGMPCPHIAHRVFAAGSSHRERKPKGLPRGFVVVYSFSLSHAYGVTCPAGANRVLRVGKATSAGRLAQHYENYATARGLPYNLANYRILWPYLGLSGALPDYSVSWTNWIEENLDRDQFEIPRIAGDLASTLEKFLRGRLGPVFEG